MRLTNLKISIILSVLFLTACVDGDFSTSADETSPKLAKISRIRITDAEVDSAEPSIATDKDGNVYIVWVEHGADKKADVFLQKFDADGKKDGKKIRVNPQAGMGSAWRGDPPTIKIGEDKTVYVGWTGTSNEGAIQTATDVFLSVSNDGGNNFNVPVKVNDDNLPVSRGMHSLGVKGNQVYLAWLDDRHLRPKNHHDKARKSAAKHHSEPNRELYFAGSNDGGKTFSANKKIAEEVCPCCKTTIAIASNGHLYIGWRQVVGEDFRHIAVASSADNGEIFTSATVVSDDQWQINGCPVSGPSLNVKAGGTLQVVWFTAGNAGAQGLYLAESNDNGKTFSSRKNLVEGIVKSSPVLLSEKSTQFVLWEGQVEGTDGTCLKPVSDFSAINHDSLPITVSEGNLPLGAINQGHIFVVNIIRRDKKRGIWLTIWRTEKTEGDFNL